MTAIWGADPGGTWRALEPAGYPAEAALHDLVEKAPQMLPLAGSPRLTMLGREVRLGAGSADLIAVEATGRLVIIYPTRATFLARAAVTPVEVKLAGNSESRTAVVARASPSRRDNPRPTAHLRGRLPRTHWRASGPD